MIWFLVFVLVFSVVICYNIGEDDVDYENTFCEVFKDD